jgi:hypothetical protein
LNVRPAHADEGLSSIARRKPAVPVKHCAATLHIKSKETKNGNLEDARGPDRPRASGTGRKHVVESQRPTCFDRAGVRRCRADHDERVILFVAGLAIVRVHNRWSGGWPVVVTVLGWLFVLGGLVRTLFPIQLGSAASAMAQESWFLVGEAVILLLVGGFLSLKAYSQA